MQIMLLLLFSVRLLLPHLWPSLRRAWNPIRIWIGKALVRFAYWRPFPAPFKGSWCTTCHHEIIRHRGQISWRRDGYDESSLRGSERIIELSSNEHLAGGLRWNNGATFCNTYNWYLQKTYSSQIKPIKTWTLGLAYARERNWRLEEASWITDEKGRWV